VLVVGLTGGIGSGKSTVAALMAELGAFVIDVDALGRDVISPGGRAEGAVAREFGPTVLDESGAVNRAALAGVVFSETERLEALEAISHPAINEDLEAILDSVDPDSVVVLDLAVLAESNLGKLQSGRGYEVVVVVEAPAEVRLARLEDRGMDLTSAAARMDAQASDAERQALADHVIVNGGTLEELQARVHAVWKQLLRSRGDGSRR
jgi:dephospho-CoA kinase